MIRIVMCEGRGVRVVTGGRGMPGPAGSQSLALALSLTGEIAASETLLRVEIADLITLDPDRCRASCDTSPSEPVALALTLNGAAAGSVTFSPGSTEGDIVLDQMTVQGLLRMTAPSETAGLADVSITLTGER